MIGIGDHWRSPVERCMVTEKKSNEDEPLLLTGGNPQIAKGDGDDPVQEYITAMPGWKGDVGRGVDDLINQLVPGVVKGIRWNSPFYGVEDRGWFLNLHCFSEYVKVTFFNGAELDPLPPDSFKDPKARALRIHEGDDLADAQLADWIKQASEIPGWIQ